MLNSSFWNIILSNGKSHGQEGNFLHMQLGRKKTIFLHISMYVIESMKNDDTDVVLTYV